MKPARAIGFSPSAMALRKAPATADSVRRNDIDQAQHSVINLRLIDARFVARVAAHNDFLRQLSDVRRGLINATKPAMSLAEGVAC